MTEIHLPSPWRALIADCVAQAYPNEACGVILGRWEDVDGAAGRSAIVTKIVPSTNCAVDPGTAFEIDLELLFGLHRQARETGEAVIGHFHSHPDGPAMPSQTDAENVTDPSMIWVIAGSDYHIMNDLRAWQWIEGGFDGLRIVKIDEGP